MRGLTASEQLRVWERGRRQTPAWRSLLLLSEASPGIPLNELARFSVGQRDSLLLKLREMMFGSEIESVVECPKCSERLELMFDISDVRAKSGDSKIGQSFLLNSVGYKIRFRLPDSTDMEAIVRCQDADEARSRLIERCIIEIKRSNQKSRQKIEAKQLPLKLIELLVERMAESDPQANIQIEFSCPACQQVWTTVFDIVSFLWSEIDERAQRILREVHAIASVYGWDEKDILEMPAVRRNSYLEMIRN